MGSGIAAGVMVPWAILPSVTDVDELITTKKRAGLYAGSMSFIRKIVQGIALFLVGFTLDKIGFISPVQGSKQVIIQAPETLEQMKVFIVLAPLTLIVLGIIFAMRFKITPITHNILTKETERLRNGGRKEEVDADTKVICEKLTGMAYEKLYIGEQETKSI
jgi:oligogalacturonide transporter